MSEVTTSGRGYKQARVNMITSRQIVIFYALSLFSIVYSTVLSFLNYVSLNLCINLIHVFIEFMYLLFLTIKLLFYYYLLFQDTSFTISIL